jgi:hypothetical protein
MLENAKNVKKYQNGKKVKLDTSKFFSNIFTSVIYKM